MFNSLKTKHYEILYLGKLIISNRRAIFKKNGLINLKADQEKKIAVKFLYLRTRFPLSCCAFKSYEVMTHNLFFLAQKLNSL